MDIEPVSSDAVDARRETGAATGPYRVKRIFRTLQGEGFYAGRPAVFVRFVGCNMWSGYEEDRARDARRNEADCPLWCDTDFRKEGSSDYSATALVRAMKEEAPGIRFCVLTGGEPLLQMDEDLLKMLHEANYQVAVETNGTVALRDRFPDGSTHLPDWIVCSPKLPENRLSLEWFDELKLVVPDYCPGDYRSFAERARTHAVDGEEIPLLWLQPEDGPRVDEARRLAVRLALERPNWRVSVQTHKMLGIA